MLFTGCEEDGENKKGILSFTARWGYVLASHSDAPEPVFGLGRVVMIADSHAAKTIHAEITELERTKVEGWEAISEHKRKTLSDPMLFSYYGQLYIQEEEASFEPKNKDAIVDFARDAFAKYTRNGVVGGLLIRIKGLDGELVGGFSPEVFPRWKPGNSYQSADDVLGFFFRANAKHMTPDLCSKIVVMPIKRYSCGPSFKNYYFLKKPDESLLKLRKRFLINNEPTVCDIAFALSRREDSGESFMLKYYPMGNPISSVADIGKPPAVEASHDVNNEQVSHQDPSVRMPVGLSETSSILLPSWYAPGSLSGLVSHAELHEEPQADITEVIQDAGLSPATPPTDQIIQLEVIDTTPDKDDIPALPAEPPVQAENLDTDVPISSAEDGDLSDLFSEISDDELNEIENAQRLALEERAKADRIHAEQEAAQEALEKAQREKSELMSTAPSTSESGQDTTPVTATPSPEAQEPAKSSTLRFVDDSARRETMDLSSAPDPEPKSQQGKEDAVDPPAIAPVKAEPELSSLEKMLKMRGLL